MPRETKFTAGGPIKSLLEVEQAINYGTWIYLRNKPVHPRFIDQMTLETVRKFINHGQLRWANKTKEV